MEHGKREAVETVEFVVRSRCRIRILDALRGGESASREELAAEVDVVRTTLQRNLEALAEQGLIRDRPDGYEITPSGALVASGVGDALALADSAVRLQPVLERLPTAALEFDLERLVDATVVEATTANPYAPVTHHQRRLTETDHARLLLPATGAKPIETAREAAEAGTVHELVVTPSVAEALRTDPAISEQYEALADSENVSVSVCEAGVPFYLGILDDVVQIGVHDENGVPTALLESSDPELREWAVGTFEEFERRSA